jgi:hypothetical protein
MTINQANSPVCLGCQQPGHTLTDCNRFVNYIVAESLAQRHPQLRAQVASAHSQFRSRINTGRHNIVRPSVNERGVIARVPFPLDGCAIVPAFPLKTGMGAVLVTPAVCEHCEAWKQVPSHFGKAVVT